MIFINKQPDGFLYSDARYQKRLERLVLSIIAVFTAIGFALPLEAQNACSNVALNDSSDGQFVVGSATGASLFQWTLNGQNFWSGQTPQLGLFHFDGSLSNMTGLAPSTATGQWFGPGKFGNAVWVAPGGLLQYPAAGNLAFGEGTIE